MGTAANLEIGQNYRNGVCILTINTDLTEQNSAALKARIEALVEQAQNRIVLDLQGHDVHNFNELMTIEQMLALTAGKLVLMGVREEDLGGVRSILTVFETEDIAVRHCQPTY